MVEITVIEEIEIGGWAKVDYRGQGQVVGFELLKVALAQQKGAYRKE